MKVLFEKNYFFGRMLKAPAAVSIFSGMGLLLLTPAYFSDLHFLGISM